MEFVEGRMLNKIIGKEIGPLPYREALTIILKILEEVKTAHQRDVIFTTLNPSYINVTPDNKVVINEITDTTLKKKIKKEGIIYRSPEELSAKNADLQSDIYSLGIILYEMLAGNLPFANISPMSDFTLMNKIVGEKLNDPREFYPNIPDWLVDIINQATAKDKSDRIKTAEEFISLLKTGSEVYETKLQEEYEKELLLQKEKEEAEKKAQEKIVRLGQLKSEIETVEPIEKTPPLLEAQSKKEEPPKRTKRKASIGLKLVIWTVLTLATFLIIYDEKGVESEWMKENLNTDVYRNGDSIPEVKDAKKWTKLKTGAWCYYNNDAENGKKYGKLYNWYAITDSRGLAPKGWQIPSKNEFEELIKILSEDEIARKAVRDGDMNNKSGFSVLLAGGRDSTGYFYDLGYVPYYWSTTEYDSINANNLVLLYHENNVSLSNKPKGYGFSVRGFKLKEKQGLLLKLFKLK